MKSLYRINYISWITLFVVYVGVNCVSVSESNGTAGDDIDGQMLLKLGRQLNKPMLTLLGMAINNLHPCAEWTRWTECGASRPGYFATRTRTRKCTEHTTTRELEKNVTTETDFSICEGFCPNDYSLTTNGFCIKLYVTAKVQDDAEKHCQQDGGYLINIDSDLKYGDVNNLLQGFGTTIYIGGRRKDAKSPWKYSYGSQSGFFKWASGQPNNGSNNLCLFLHGSSRLWYDVGCTGARPFLCEITV